MDVNLGETGETSSSEIQRDFFAIKFALIYHYTEAFDCVLKRKCFAFESFEVT